MIFREEHLQTYPELPQIVLANCGLGGGFGPGQDWEQQSGQKSDDRDHYEQLDQSKRAVRRLNGHCRLAQTLPGGPKTTPILDIQSHLHGIVDWARATISRLSLNYLITRKEFHRSR